MLAQALPLGKRAEFAPNQELRPLALPKIGAEICHLPQAWSRGPLLFPNSEPRPLALPKPRAETRHSSPGSGRTGPGKGNGSAQNKQPTQRGFPPSPPSKQMFTVVLVQKLRVWKGSLKSPNCRFQRAGCYRHTAISGAQGVPSFPRDGPQDNGKRPQTPEVPQQHGGTSPP